MPRPKADLAHHTNSYVKTDVFYRFLSETMVMKAVVGSMVRTGPATTPPSSLLLSYVLFWGG